MRVIEREKGHYEVSEVPYGKVYSWRPERVIFECDCGNTLTWTAPVTICACGAAHTDVLQEPGDRRPRETPYRPWLDDYAEWRRERDAKGLRHEYFMSAKAGSDD